MVGVTEARGAWVGWAVGDGLAVGADEAAGWDEGVGWAVGDGDGPPEGSVARVRDGAMTSAARTETMAVEKGRRR